MVGLFFVFFSPFWLLVLQLNYVCLCYIHVHIHAITHHMHVVVRGQPVEISYLALSLYTRNKAWCHVPWPTKLAHWFLVCYFRLFWKKIDLTSNIITADVLRMQLHNETFIKLCVGGKLQLVHKNDHFKVFADRNKETKYKTFSATLSK